MIIVQIQTLFAVWSLVGQAQVEGVFAKIAQVILKPNTLKPLKHPGKCLQSYDLNS